MEKGENAFPLLIRQLNDMTYSYTDTGGASGPNLRIGDICFRIVGRQIEVYHGVLGKEQGTSDQFFPTKESLIAWWKKNQDKSLREMQIEATQWMLAKEKNRKVSDQEWHAKRIRKLNKLISRLERSETAVKVSRSDRLVDEE